MPKFSNPRAPLAMERNAANRPLDWGLQDVIDDRNDAMAPRGQFSAPTSRLEQLENNYLTDNPYFQWPQRDGRVGAQPRTLANLGEQPGVPLATLGDALGDPRAPNPTLEQVIAANRAAPGPGGPMPSPEQIQAYLRMTGQIYPQLPPVNPAGWEAFLARAPESLNIEDRRGINRRR